MIEKPTFNDFQCLHQTVIDFVGICGIMRYKGVYINEKRCIGCGICASKCLKSAINMQTKEQDYDEILPKLIAKGIDCIEFHAISKNEKDVLEKRRWFVLDELENM